MKLYLALLPHLLSVTLLQAVSRGQELPSPPLLTITVDSGQSTLHWAPYPAAETFRVLSAPELPGPFALEPSGSTTGYQWTGPLADPATGRTRFHRLEVVPLNTNSLLAANLLNRIAYGSTPDDLERLASIGTQLYIAEQLAPESIAEDLDTSPAPTPPEWQYVTQTGIATSSQFMLHLSHPGEVFLDDIILVAGTSAGIGTNLLKNGGFEGSLAPWQSTAAFAASKINTQFQHTGNSSLQVLTSTGAVGNVSGIVQTITPPLKLGQTYTVSYWYLPSSNGGNLSVRIHGGGLHSAHPVQPGIGTPAVFYSRLTSGAANLDDLRTWYLLHAVQSKRQLFEILSEFMNNHFTTEHDKTRMGFNGRGLDPIVRDRAATEAEFRELERWRSLLLDPNATFHDFLKVSAESPAMIIYLDTVTSTAKAPNENYARELFELFTMGVDNGYDQADIEEMSKVWTGWGFQKLPVGQEHNPLAAPVPNQQTGAGVWAFSFVQARHATGAKTIFPGRTVDPRFGPPRAGLPYELRIPARQGTNGIQDGYQAITFLADLPYTQEFISVKLCRLFIHERFAHGVYDYMDPNRTPEMQLVADCMAAWESPGPDGRKGNLRNIVSVILNSELFRTHASSRQKVKTPLEFVVSAVRALRAPLSTGGFASDTDGFDLRLPIENMGLKLFERPDPDGWPEYGRDWVNTSAVVERMRFIHNLLVHSDDPLKRAELGETNDDNVTNPVALLQSKLTPDLWRNAGAVADYFLGILFLGEGKANLDLDRATAVAFLNSNDAGLPDSSPFASLDPASREYDQRLRGMVAFLMSLPRFQEQ